MVLFCSSNNSASNSSRNNSSMYFWNNIVIFASDSNNNNNQLRILTGKSARCQGIPHFCILWGRREFPSVLFFARTDGIPERTMNERIPPLNDYRTNERIPNDWANGQRADNERTSEWPNGIPERLNQTIRRLGFPIDRMADWRLTDSWPTNDWLLTTGFPTD